MSRLGTAAAGSTALFASWPAQSRGRRHLEPASPSRTEFQRDRDRVIHSTAFRRLQHKTQVFVHHVGDHYRTRLTHTIEVAQIARSAARAIGLNEDLAEALALAHDLGHPPFGHAGEEALNTEIAEFGGFDHNVQTLRIVTRLERRYADFDGLNLTWETLEGIAKHNGPLSGPHSPPNLVPAAVAQIADDYDLEPNSFAGPEAQIASLADDIAYINHDIDDGVRAELFSLEALTKLPLVGPLLRNVMADYASAKQHRLLHETIRRLIDGMLGDMIGETRRRAEQAEPANATEVRAMNTPLVAFSDAMAEKVREIRAFLFENMYRHREVLRRADEGAGIVADLYRGYTREPEALPGNWQAPAAEETPAQTARRIADFIAGMTDLYAQSQHKQLSEGHYKNSQNI